VIGQAGKLRLPVVDLRHMYRLDIPDLLGRMAKEAYHTLEKGVDGGYLIVVIFDVHDNYDPNGNYQPERKWACR
jgi:hypothetical protein